jgi:hypothetical protein
MRFAALLSNFAILLQLQHMIDGVRHGDATCALCRNLQLKQGKPLLSASHHSNIITWVF